MTLIRKSIVVVITLVTAATFQLQSVSAQQPVNDRAATIARNTQTLLAQEKAKARQQQFAQARQKVLQAAQAQLRRHLELRQREQVAQPTKQVQSQIHPRYKVQERIMSQKKGLHPAEPQQRKQTTPPLQDQVPVRIPQAELANSGRLPINDNTVFPIREVPSDNMDAVQFQDDFSGPTNPGPANPDIENTLFGDAVATGVHAGQGGNAFARTNQTKMSARLAAVVSQRRTEISLLRDEAIEKGDRQQMEAADRMEKKLKAFVWSQAAVKAASLTRPTTLAPVFPRTESVKVDSRVEWNSDTKEN